MTPLSNKIVITEDESKTCKIDGKKFNSHREMIWYVKKAYNMSFEEYIIKCYYNGTRPVCLSSGVELSFKGNKLGPWFSDYTKNKTPRKQHSDETKLKIKEGCKKTSLKKYGVENVFSSEWCKEKIKSTIIEKYGVDNVMKLEEYKKYEPRTKESLEKARETNVKKYGAITYTSSPEWKTKLREQSFIQFYGNWEAYIKSLEARKINCVSGSLSDIIERNPILYKCKIDGAEWSETQLLQPICPRCLENGNLSNRSKMETEMCGWLNSIGIKFKTNNRFKSELGTYELDFYLPEKKIGIELNGNYYHSQNGGGKDRKYHINKLDAVNSIGIELIQIFEDEWIKKFDIVKDKILSKIDRKSFTSVYARRCSVVKLNTSEANQFYECNHIQGGSNSSVNYGLLHNDILVAVISFSSLRPSLGNKKADGEYELIRYASKIGHTVCGGFGKLLSRFIKEFLPKKIITYADRRYSGLKNNVYGKLGFRLISVGTPNYWYVKKLDRKHRFNFTKGKLVNDGFDSAKTEWQIMQERGWDRIWDCGHIKYEMLVK
jgi:very-short-patch-repair endonuclease